MEFGVLGPLSVSVAGRPIARGGPQLRRLLSALLLTPSRAWGTDALAEVLWADTPTRGDASAVRSYVARLRRTLGDDRGTVIRTDCGGYRFEPGDHVLDVTEFEVLLARAAAAPDPGRRVDLLTDALSLWRGTPFADLAGCEAADAEGRRLEERRLCAVEDQFSARLDIGHHRTLVADLEGLTAVHPWRERLHVQHALALYRSGRQVDALRALHSHRRRLADETGLTPSQRLVELESAIAAGSWVPPPGAAPADETVGAAGNLPPDLSTFVGRDEESSRLLAAVASNRVVTVVGAAGVGKTRLAVRILRESGSPGRTTWFVDLAQVTADDDVVDQVSAVLGARPGPGGDLLDAVQQRLLVGPAALLLDSCEHVVHGVAALVEGLLGRCPDVRVLATSRAPLRVVGEQVVPLRPLPIEGAEGGDGDAVELFMTRSRSADPAFDATAATPDVRSLCRRLDGLPLAIELAAARMRTVTPADVLRQWDEKRRMPGWLQRTGSERHRTLSDAIGWSYNLLDESQRAMFERASVFGGPFSLEDAVAVCGDGGDGGDDALDLFPSLVDASLVEVGPDDPRYRMLDVVRAFGRDRLTASGAAGLTRAHHACRFRELAAEARRACPGPQERSAFEATVPRVADYHAAVRWSVDAGRVDDAVSIVVDLAAVSTLWLWIEPHRWLWELLDDPPCSSPDRWVELLGLSWYGFGDTELTDRYTQAALDLDPHQPHALLCATHLALQDGDIERVGVLAATTLESALDREDGLVELWSRFYLGTAHLTQGNRRAALAAAVAIEQLGRRTGSPACAALGSLLRSRIDTDADRVRSHLDRAVGLAATTRVPVCELNAGRDLAWSAFDRDPQGAARGLREHFRRIVETGERSLDVRACQLAAVLLAVNGFETDAAVIVGRVGLPALPGSDAPRLEAAQRALGSARAQLSPSGPCRSVPEIAALTASALEALGRGEGPP